MRRTLGVLVVALLALLAMAWPASGASRGSGAAPTPSRTDRVDRVDFNGDGFDDLAVGASGEAVGAQVSAGAVNVLYGSPDGLAGANQTIVQGNPEAGDSFGTALAKHDFNGDGFIDLAVGAPQETLGAAVDTGAVTVFYGGPDGLPTSGGQVLTQGNVEDFDFFGGAMDAGFFDDDAYADLAVGASGENVAGQGGGTGAVNVFYGSADGLAATSQVLTQANPEGGDNFGAAVVAGSFNGTGGDDLAVGAPGEDVGGAVAAGAVNVFYATPGGLSGNSQTRVQGNPELGDLFGSSLAAGFLDGDDDQELAAGAPGETVGGQQAAGAVNVFAGSANGLLMASSVLTQSPGSGGVVEETDEFGAALASGPFNDDAFWDLAVGVPGEGLGTRPSAGVVQVVFGADTGPAGIDQTLSQDTPGVPGLAESFDRFGDALARGVSFNNFNGDGFADLAVGVPLEGVGAAQFAGAVNVLYGAAAGLTGSGSQQFTQGAGTGGLAESFDNFGRSLD
jgi:hypothetical protein